MFRERWYRFFESESLLAQTLPTPKMFYFDLGNVLLNFSRATAFRQMSEVSGVPVNRIREILEDGQLQVRYESGELNSRQCCELFCQQSGVQTDCDSLLEAGSDMFRLNVGVVPIILQLALARHRLGVLSNTCEAHWQHCLQKRFGVLQSVFEIHILSYEVKAMKPDEKIYAAAAEAARLLPQEIFFIDDMDENIEAARRFGFDAVQYQSPRQVEEDLRKRGVCFNY
ncbi:MAG: hypothetical protein CMJ62_10770 [Planctomycetaceae bacterium]|nr:hypothetical protein [Planctomycetaceae bacterium]